MHFSACMHLSSAHFNAYPDQLVLLDGVQIVLRARLGQHVVSALGSKICVLL